MLNIFICFVQNFFVSFSGSVSIKRLEKGGGVVTVVDFYNFTCYGTCVVFHINLCFIF